MPAISATAPGKIILFGEHAVVYNQPAIAVPVKQVQARVVITPRPGKPSGKVRLVAPAIDLDAEVDDLSHDHPLVQAILLTQESLKLPYIPACLIRISSTIPVAAGLGSGAAVSVAIIRALSHYVGQPLMDADVNRLAFEVEKIHHGTPSGIDNTVITYAHPVFYQRGEPLQWLSVPHPFTLVIGNTGIASPTAKVVSEVRQGWQADPERWEALFASVGKIATSAREAIESGGVDQLGELMNENHALLQKMSVSSVELDQLVRSARQAGALGAKLSGGGRGGNMIAIAEPEKAPEISEALLESGAAQTIITTISNAQSTAR